MDKTTTNFQAEDDTAEALLPAEGLVPFAGQDITVKPLSVLQVIQISRTLKQVLPALDKLQVLLGGNDAALAEPGTDEIGLVIELLADYGEPLTEGIAIAIGKPVDFVRGANDFAGLFALIAAIVRINSDFFGQQVGPLLAGLRNPAASGAGPTPSTGLSAPATH